MSPVLNETAGHIIIDDPSHDVRDCTPPQQDQQLTWHVWCTRIPVAVGPGGYNGVIGHWFSDTLNGSAWEFGGVALNASTNATEWDSHGVFTPGSIYDSVTDEWRLFYGGVGPNFEHHGKEFSEWQGLASSKSPYGPFVRDPLNPIIKSPLGPTPLAIPPGEGDWIRIDNPRAVYVSKTDQRFLIVKGVDLNFTATPNAFTPAGPGWSPPYTAVLSNPCAAPQPQYPSGFENQEIMKGPDGLFHMIGHSHGGSPKDFDNPHVITSDLSQPSSWKFAELHPTWNEPAPVARGIPGDQMEVPTHMIRFDGRPLKITLYPITWTTIEA